MNKQTTAVEPKSVDPHTQLGRACRDGDAEGVAELLAGGSDPNQPILSALGWTITPLIEAIDVGANDCVRLLLAAGADPNAVCEDFDYSLHGRARCTPLLLADVTCNVSARRLLLAHGADPGLAEKLGVSRKTFRPARNVRAKFLVGIERALRLIHRRATIRQIDRALLRVRDLDEQGGALLASACRSRRVAAVELLLESGADPNRMTMLTLVEADDGRGAIAALLLHHGYEMRRQWYGTPLVAACARGNEPVAKALLDYGCEPDVAADRPDGAPEPTSLVAAIVAQSLACVTLLLSRGAHPDLAVHGAPSLHADASAHDVPFRTAVESCFRGSATPGSNRTPPLLIACGLGSTELVAALLEHGASVTMLDDEGNGASEYLDFVRDPVKRAEINAMLLRPPPIRSSPPDLF